MPNEHYYTPSPGSESRPQSVTLRTRGVQLRLLTDSGVFSKRGLDYGTRLLIETVDLPAAAEAVDLGCGYGVVAAVLGRVYPDSRWLLLDVNRRALELARANVAELGARATVLESDGFAAAANACVDAILVNPPIRAGKAVVQRLFAESRDHLQPAGSLWVVIHKKHGAESARRYLETLFPAVELVERDKGYQILRCTVTER